MRHALYANHIVHTQHSLQIGQSQGIYFATEKGYISRWLPCTTEREERGRIRDVNRRVSLFTTNHRAELHLEILLMTATSFEWPWRVIIQFVVENGWRVCYLMRKRAIDPVWSSGSCRFVGIFRSTVNAIIEILSFINRNTIPCVVCSPLYTPPHARFIARHTYNTGRIIRLDPPVCTLYTSWYHTKILSCVI